MLCTAVLLLLAGCRGTEPASTGGSLDLLPLARWAGDAGGGTFPPIRFRATGHSFLLGEGWATGPGSAGDPTHVVSEERHASLHLPLCPDKGGGAVGIVLCLRDPKAGSGGKAGVIISFNGLKVIRLIPGAEWADHRLEIPADWFRQGLNELVLSGDPGRVAVRSLGLWLPGPQAHLTMGDTTRRALVSSGPLEVDLPDPLPAGALLDISLPNLPYLLSVGTEPVRYRLEGWRGGEWELIFETVDGLGHPKPMIAWQNHLVSLEQLAGEKGVRLRLSADGTFQAWGPLSLSWPGNGCSPEAVAQDGPNLILILADTLRADRLGAGGSAGRLTPALDALAAESVHFRDTLAQAPSTVPSISSFFTGRYFNRINRWVNRKNLPVAVPLFAEALSGAGCRTLAVVANPLMLPEAGFARGFDEYHHLPGMARKFFGREDLPVHQPAEVVNQRFLQRLPSLARGRFFAYLHYMDPHDPYLVEDGAELRFSGGRLDDLPWEGWLGPAVEEIIAHGNSSIGPHDRRMVARAYDNGVRHLDRQLGLLLAELRRRGLLSNTVVAVVADHGEEFFEHGLVGHGHTVYEELLRVPALVHFPGQPGYPRPAVVTRRVELLDVAATLLDVMGAGPSEGHAGSSLLPMLLGETGVDIDRARYFETRRRSWVKPPLNDFLAGMERDGWKLTLDRLENEVWLHYLESDPNETRDLEALHPEIAEEMQLQLRSWLDEQKPLQPEMDEAASTGRAVAERETEALKALGYMQ